jgi:hypothetical protein
MVLLSFIYLSGEEDRFSLPMVITTCHYGGSSISMYSLRLALTTEGGRGEGKQRECLCTVKKVHEFPVPSRDVTTKLSLGGNNDVITELFLPGGSLVSDIPAGDGNS